MSLQIGRYIAFALGEENAPELFSKIQGRVSPVVQPEDSACHMPYVWYCSTGMQELFSKDGIYGSTCQVEIEVVAQSYSEMVDILLLVRQAMGKAWQEWDGSFSVSDQTFAASAEEYDDSIQAFCRKLAYTIETNE